MQVRALLSELLFLCLARRPTGADAATRSTPCAVHAYQPFLQTVCSHILSANTQVCLAAAMATRTSVRARPVDINRPLTIVRDVSELDTTDGLFVKEEAPAGEATGPVASTSAAPAQPQVSGAHRDTSSVNYGIRHGLE